MKEHVSGIEASKETLRMMATREFTRELKSEIHSRRPLLYVVTNEEKRIIDYFTHLTIAGGYRTFIWDCYRGLLNISTMQPEALISGDSTDVVATLDWIIKEATETHESEIGDTKKNCKGYIYLMLDFHRHLKPLDPEVERRLRTLARMNTMTSLVMVAPVLEISPALEKDIAVLDFPYPNDDELKAALYTVVDSFLEIGGNPKVKQETLEHEDEIVRSVHGLTLAEAQSAFSKSVVIHKKLVIPTIIKQKQQIIRKTGVLEYFEPEVGIEDVGGLGNLITWLKQKKHAFNSDAREYGLPTPRGCIIFGIPGSGKSLSAKATAKEYDMPLLRLDFGSLFGSYIGDSERNARQAIKIAEAAAPCVLWCDEIEKGLSGFRSSGRSDSGVTNRVISTFLTWLQEKKSAVFVIATANQVDDIPPEFTRAGRFDELFFADLPNNKERLEILKALLRRKKRDFADFDCLKIVNASESYTGAEIEKAIETALFYGYEEGKRPITTADIVKALATFKPISKTQPELVARMQEWAAERCVRANSIQ